MSLAPKAINVRELFQICDNRLTKEFTELLRDIPSLELKAAMDYTVKNGGKHLRPLLIYATGCIFGAAWENMDIPAVSIELIHTYSLIHDDLPCMDNADLRRGKPSCHKAFGEAIAVLTGDALHNLAIQILTRKSAPLSAPKRLSMIDTICMASGPFGMAAGQTLDIHMMNDTHISDDLLLTIYKLKTGKLFSACIELGWLASNDTNETHREKLKQFGECIGLAFQIQDDILDVTASAEITGKPQHLDAQNNKVTYVSRHGLKKAKETVANLYEQGLSSIDYFGHHAQLLRELTTYMLERNA